MSRRRRSTIEAVLEANAYRLGNSTVFAVSAENSAARVLSETLVNVAREVDAALGNDHEEPLRGVRSLQRYRWAGIPGQYEMTTRIQIGSLSAQGWVNTTLVDDDDEPMASHISVGDLAACIQAGWLVLEEAPDGERPEQLVRLPLLTIEEARAIWEALTAVVHEVDGLGGEWAGGPHEAIGRSLLTAVAEAISSAERQGADQ